MVNKKDSKQTVIMAGMPTIGINHPDYKLLSACVAFLGGYFGSRLMKNIREKKGYTYNIYSAIMNNKYASYVYIESSVKHNFYEQVLKEIKNEIERLQNDTIPEDELVNFKQYMIGNFLCSFDNIFDSLNTYQYLDVLNTDINFYEDYLNVLKTITAGQIQDMARKYLNVDMTNVIVE